MSLSGASTPAKGGDTAGVRQRGLRTDCRVVWLYPQLWGFKQSLGRPDPRFSHLHVGCNSISLSEGRLDLTHALGCVSVSLMDAPIPLTLCVQLLEKPGRP